MPLPEPRVHRRRTALTVAVTGARGELGARVACRLSDDPAVRRVLALDVERGGAAAGHPGVTWRRVDVRDPVLATRLAGADVVVHLATDRGGDADETQRRALNVHGTDTVLAAAPAAGVRRVVLVTSAMTYGALPDNPVPLPEDAPLRAQPDRTLIGDWVEMERLAATAARAHPSVDVVPVRPASVVGAVTDPVLPRLFEAPRLLALKGTEPRWQFCHSDDLVTAVARVAVDGAAGPVTVAADGWLGQADVERISGLRSLVVPLPMAFATAERLQRVGVLPAPASELNYLAHPWVVDAGRLRAAGWTPEWTNERALRAHLEAIGDRVGRALPRLQRKDATRAAAGATVALVGTVAIARARAARRRHHG